MSCCHAIVKALQGAQEILIVRLARAKQRLVKHVHAHDHALVERIVGGNGGPPQRRAARQRALRRPGFP